MNWKMEAVEKLKRYGNVQTAAVTLPRQIKALEDAEIAIRDQKDKDKLLDNLTEQQELKWQGEKTKTFLDIVGTAFESLNPEDRLVLYRMYVNPEKNAVSKLCGELHIEQSSVYRRRDKALLLFTRALYGIVEEV